MNIEKHSKNCVRELFATFDLHPEDFSKKEIRKGKTPDFRVMKGNEFVFFCEVKSPQEDPILDNLLDQTQPGILVGGERPDSTFNRLTSHIHRANKQFDEVNADSIFPNVLVFVNFDWASDCNDLWAVLTGQFTANNGVSYPIYIQFSEGRILEEKYRIHFYIWIDDLKPGIEVYSVDNFSNVNQPMVIYHTFNNHHFVNLQNIFNIDTEEPAGGWFKRRL